jgi:chemotaxis protein CheZ
MSASRKRFRVEQATIDDLPMPEPIVVEGGEIGPMHREIMAELRSIRAQMAANAAAHRAAAGETTETAVAREIAETQALLETHRAQIEQCKAQGRADLIHDAISRTSAKSRLHGKSFTCGDGEGQWRARRRRRRHRTGHPADPEATEAIDQAATALSKNISPTSKKLLKKSRNASSRSRSLQLQDLPVSASAR